MERIKQMHLKKALFVIALINSTAALILSVFSFWGCLQLSEAIAPQEIALYVQSESFTRIEAPEPAKAAAQIANLISVLQFVLPIVFYTGAMLLTAGMYYRLKLKEPMEMLAKGASKIIKNDLDFTMAAKSQDELGQLCTAFETMRGALLENNQELWRQAEERKRLNAAFSHNLRNPVTVLKGSVKLARKAVAADTKADQIDSHLSRIESYTDRIAHYIETMSSIQKLEEVSAKRAVVQWDGLIGELKNMIEFAALDSNMQITFWAGAYTGDVWIDTSFFFQIAENLVSNAIRFAVHTIAVSCCVDGQVLELSVTDDGCGFPDKILKNGILPFQQGKEEAGHFGMGLYACSLLCQRHGGRLSIQNLQMGAEVLAVLGIQKI